MEAGLLETDKIQMKAFDPNDIVGLAEGGRGLFLIKQNMDKITYHSEAGTHHL